jgi:23S rRNA (uracil1939-C5)-methyltransferase
MLSPGSHQVVPIERCLIADGSINAAIAGLVQLNERDRKRLSFCEQLELRSATTSPKLAVRLYPRQGAQLRAEVYASLFPPFTTVVIAGSAADDGTYQVVDVAPQIPLRIPLSAFSQVHAVINRSLVDAVVRAAKLRSLRTFLDAYAGSGNFAIPLLGAGLLGEAVDTWGPAILAARGLARDLGLPFTGFAIGDAPKTLRQYASAHRQFDYVVLDPPRSGAKSVLDIALQLEPRVLSLVGCDPVSLARDLGTLVRRGARIESLTVFDMFPETHHFETLAIVDCGR